MSAELYESPISNDQVSHSLTLVEVFVKKVRPKSSVFGVVFEGTPDLEFQFRSVAEGSGEDAASPFDFDRQELGDKELFQDFAVPLVRISRIQLGLQSQKHGKGVQTRFLVLVHSRTEWDDFEDGYITTHRLVRQVSLAELVRSTPSLPP